MNNIVYITSKEDANYEVHTDVETLAKKYNLEILELCTIIKYGRVMTKDGVQIRAGRLFE